jgi:hypothetical protein
VARPERTPPDVDTRDDAVHDAAASARARADDARRRAAAAREAADRATTEYARTSHLRVADFHAEVALLRAQDAHALGAARDGQKPD